MSSYKNKIMGCDIDVETFQKTKLILKPITNYLHIKQKKKTFDINVSKSSVYAIILLLGLSPKFTQRPFGIASCFT
jgi:hypothetical protein